MLDVLESSAVISDCETYRYRLDRGVQPEGIVFAYFGVNGSTAGPIEEDHTTQKWRGFTLRNGGQLGSFLICSVSPETWRRSARSCSACLESQS